MKKLIVLSLVALIILGGIGKCFALQKPKAETMPTQLRSTDFSVEKVAREATGGKTAGYLFLPAGKTKIPYPVVITIHGGFADNPEHADRATYRNGLNVASHLCPLGFAVFSVDYRWSAFGMEEMEDVSGAFDYLITRSEIDAKQIIIMGGSHGGYMTMMAVTSEKYKRPFALAINLYGFVDITNLVNASKEKNNPQAQLTIQKFGLPIENANAYKEISPRYHIEKLDVPLLIIVGTKDQFIKQLRAFKRDLEKAGKNFEYYEVEGAPHGFEERHEPYTSKLWQIVTEYLKKNLNKEVSIKTQIPATNKPIDTSIAKLSFVVKVKETIGTIKSFNDVQGAPKPLNGTDADLSEKYKMAGVKLVRLPQDDGFEYTLGGIFPDANADPDDPTAYHFEKIDLLIKSIIDAGATPLWEATYDIGASDFWAGNLQAGRPPQNLKKWASVIEHTLRHWNDGWANGYTYNIEYMESINEPFGLGGFKRNQPEQFFKTFAVFSETIQNYNKKYGHKVKVVGMGNPTIDETVGQRLDEDLALLDKFLDYLKKNNVHIDIFSYHNYDEPQKQLKVAKIIRQHLNEKGFSTLALMNSEWNIWGQKVPPYMRNDEALHSAYTAAHNAQVKTLLQELWDYAITYRANRPSDKGRNREAYEYMYFYANGKPKPAYYGWLIFADLEKNTPQRLSASSPDKNSDVTILAAKSSDVGAVSVLLSNWSEKQYDYQVALKGLSQDKIYVVNKYIVDKNTNSFEPESILEIKADEFGNTQITETIQPYSLHFLKLVPKEKE